MQKHLNLVRKLIRALVQLCRDIKILTTKNAIPLSISFLMVINVFLLITSYVDL